MAALLCCTTIFAFAEAGPICDALLGKADATSGGDVPARVKWTTDADGNVDITILPFSKAEETTDKPTAWRGRGVADNLTAAKGWEMTINGEAAVVEDYFDKNYTSNGTQSKAPNVYQLKIKVGKQAELAGKTVVIKKTTKGDNICWWTPRGNNAYGKAEFEYLYGSICEDATLAAPTNVAVDANGVLTFDAVTGADAYAANIYFNGEMIKSMTVTSGVELTRLMNTGATFEVKVVAKSGAVESEESAAATWVVADEPLTVGTSEYCDFVIGNNDNERAAMTWQTDAEGNINITISGDDATWRGTAFKGITYFWVGECPASAFFVEEYTQGSAVYTLKLKDATKKPVAGETIQFKGTYQWKTATGGNAYAENVTFTYTYGSACAGLAAPTNVAVDANGVITFDAVDGADNYVVTIYNNDLPVAIYNGITSGITLSYQAIVSGTYNVTVYAQGEGALDSDESVPFAWVLTGTPWTPEKSTVCGVQYATDTYEGNPYLVEDSYMEISMYTRNDSIIVAILPVLDLDLVTFRTNDALGIASFTTYGAPLSNYFTTNSKDGELYYVLAPKAGVSLPHGTVITYNGTLKWATLANPNSYKNNVTFTCVYGSACEEVNNDPTGIGEVQGNNVQSSKVLMDGNLYIIVGEQMYDAQGREIVR